MGELHDTTCLETAKTEQCECRVEYDVCRRCEPDVGPSRPERGKDDAAEEGERQHDCRIGEHDVEEREECRIDDDDHPR